MVVVAVLTWQDSMAICRINSLSELEPVYSPCRILLIRLRSTTAVEDDVITDHTVYSTLFIRTHDTASEVH